MINSNARRPMKVRFPRARVLTSKKNKTSRSKRKKDGRSIVRGKEVSVSESASERQLIYGRMKVGGVITFVSTNADSHAYLQTGSANNQIIWTARAAGSAGNAITVTLVLISNNASIIVGVVGSAITVTVRSSSGTPLSTADDVIAAIRANGSADALVGVSRGDGTGAGIVQAASAASLENGGGTWLHSIHTLAGHQIDAIEEFYLDNREVTLGGLPDDRWGSGIWANKVFMQTIYGHDDQEAQPDLHIQLPSLWTENHRQRGCAGAYVINVYNQNLYAEGFPQANFLVRGKPVYDPRTLTTAWSQNGALIIADFLTSDTYGFGIDYSDIDETALIAAADLCDEDVDGDPRYQINGACDFGDPDSILSELLDAIDGDVVESGGKYYIYAGEYRTPTITITKDDLRGPVQITTHVSRSDNFNSVRATFVDPNADYKEIDCPIVKNTTYITEDGMQLFQDLAFNWVTSAKQAQRLMRIELEKVRQGQTLVLPLKISGLLLQGKDNCFVTLAEFGFSAKVYEVRELSSVIEDDGSVGVDVVLRETAEGIWEDTGDETTTDLAPDSGLPDPTDVAEPENVTLTSGTTELYLRQDGAVFSRLKVSWDGATDEFVVNGGRYELQYKKDAASDWSMALDLPGYMEFYHILDVQDGEMYDVRIRAVNTLDYASDWVEVNNHTVIGKTEPPSDITGLTATINDFGVIVSCDPITDLDADLYEFRVTSSGQTWDDSTVLASIRGTSFNWNFQVAGTYELMAKAVDTSGNYSDTEDTYDLVIAAPNAPTVSTEISGENAIISWTAATGQFAIKEYEVRYGASYAGGTTLIVITGLSAETKITWGGDRTFFVAARDVAGNTGADGSSTLNIENPNEIQNFLPTVSGNNVLLDWDAPVITSLPIQAYHVYKGDVFATAALLGTVTGTFNTYVERTGGTFTYWIVSEDTAGNLSTEVSKELIVSEPKDFYIQSDIELEPYFTFSEHAIKGGGFYAPGEDEDSWFVAIPSDVVDESSMPLIINNATESFETWAEHFVTYPTMADMIAAGYTHFLMPTTTDPGYIEFFFDYGVVFGQSFIDLTWEEELLAGSVTVTPLISTSEDNITYEDFAASQAFATNFRYVKYRIEFTGADDKSLLRIFNPNARLSLKIDEEYSQVTANSADVSGTPSLNGTLVTFTKEFLDVRDIQASAQGVNAYFPVVNFDDVPNPTGFRILLFDKDGTRVTGVVSYRVIGAVNPE